MNKDTNYNPKDALPSVWDAVEREIANIKQQIRVKAFEDCTNYLADLIEPTLNSDKITDSEKLAAIRRILLIKDVLK